MLLLPRERCGKAAQLHLEHRDGSRKNQEFSYPACPRDICGHLEIMGSSF